MSVTPISTSSDLFTPEFKRLKARHPPPDLSTVLDLYSQKNEKVQRLKLQRSLLTPVIGLMQCEKWQVFEFSKFPGFMVILNPFINGFQRYWVARCLRDFPADRENVTNLSALGDESGFDLWQDFVKRQSTFFSKQDPLRKLRWATLGYHYNWTSKEYSEDHKAEFPRDVSCLTKYLAHCLGFDQFKAEAAIVNFYHLDSTLAGHTDHSELDHSAPLFSISFGQPAVFLLGGPKKSTKPTALLLRSGDICVMSGRARLAYHAVPKILQPYSGIKSYDNCFDLNSDNWTDINKEEQNEENGLCQATCKKGVIEDTSLGSDNNNQECAIITDIGEFSGSSYEHEEFMKCKLRSTSLCGCEDFKTLETHSGKDLQDAGISSEVDYSSYIDSVDKVNRAISEQLPSLDFTPFQTYLDTSRINLNVRQVIPPGYGPLKSREDG